MRGKIVLQKVNGETRVLLFKAETRVGKALTRLRLLLRKSDSFDPSKHPHSSVNGQFIKVNHTEEEKAEAKNGRRTATTFLSEELFEDHFQRHRTEITKEKNDEKAKEIYIQKARKFFDKEPTHGVEYAYDKADDTLYKYDKKTNELGICNAQGNIITYFKPKRKKEYWYEQVIQRYGLQIIFGDR
jgi:pyocin large subunit-like protein